MEPTATHAFRQRSINQSRINNQELILRTEDVGRRKIDRYMRSLLISRGALRPISVTIWALSASCDELTVGWSLELVIDCKAFVSILTA